MTMHDREERESWHFTRWAARRARKRWLAGSGRDARRDAYVNRKGQFHWQVRYLDV
jgi:hypothetical protein